jgi:hypothetical protein
MISPHYSRDQGRYRQEAYLPGLIGVRFQRNPEFKVRIVALENRISLVIEGLPEDEGRVRLNAFMAELQHLSAALARLDREANDGKPASYFQVVQLSYSSPVVVAVEPKPISAVLDVGEAIVERFGNVANAISSGTRLDGFDADLLEDIRALASPVGRSVQSAMLLYNESKFELTPRVVSRVDDALAVVDECGGSLEGMLEQINIHHGANTFYIYPDVGPRKVMCHFPAALFYDAVSAVGRRVEVSGMLKFRVGAAYPHQISVTGIDAFPPDHELPDWEDLRGMASDATGDLSSEAFVRELRDAWR